MCESSKETKVAIDWSCSDKEAIMLLDLLFESNGTCKIELKEFLRKCDFLYKKYYFTEKCQTERNKIKILLSMVEEMQSLSPEKSVLITDLIKEAEDQGIDNAKELIQMLKVSGELFETKPNYIRKV